MSQLPLAPASTTTRLLAETPSTINGQGQRPHSFHTPLHLILAVRAHRHLPLLLLLPDSIPLPRVVLRPADCFPAPIPENTFGSTSTGRSRLLVILNPLRVSPLLNPLRVSPLLSRINSRPSPGPDRFDNPTTTHDDILFSATSRPLALPVQRPPSMRTRLLCG
jgi:hypothetical protein